LTHFPSHRRLVQHGRVGRGNLLGRQRFWHPRGLSKHDWRRPEGARRRQPLT